MPNTLCHFAIQTPLSRLAIKQTDLLWVVIGCIIPDVPWILQRILITAGWLNPYDLRLYVMAQASFAFCLLLSLAISSMTRRPVIIFFILSINCLMHLLIDSLQIKWGNGVHLFAPFNWEMFRIGLFWPEHLPTRIISVLGIPILLFNWRKIVGNGLELEYRSLFQIAVTTLLILFYYIGPFIFFNQLEASNSCYIKTMRQVEQRAGEYIEFERTQYDANTHTAKFFFSGEELKIIGVRPEKSGRVSLQGHFLNRDTIVSKNYHLHTDHRDLAAIIGLLMACALVIHSFILTLSKKTT